jgi:hypothetical protein
VCVNINCVFVCDGEEVLVVEESEQGATSREVVLNFQMEAFGFPDDHHRRRRIQDSLCCRRRRSCLRPVLLLPLLRLSHLIFLFHSFLDLFVFLTDFGFLGLLFFFFFLVFIIHSW